MLREYNLANMELVITAWFITVDPHFKANLLSVGLFNSVRTSFEVSICLDQVGIMISQTSFLRCNCYMKACFASDLFNQIDYKVLLVRMKT